MLHTPFKPTPAKQAGNTDHQATPPAKIRDASRKDWPGPRWPFCAMRGPDGRISVPLPLNEN